MTKKIAVTIRIFLILTIIFAHSAYYYLNNADSAEEYSYDPVEFGYTSVLDMPRVLGANDVQGLIDEVEDEAIVDEEGQSSDDVVAEEVQSQDDVSAEEESIQPEDDVAAEEVQSQDDVSAEEESIQPEDDVVAEESAPSKDKFIDKKDSPSKPIQFTVNTFDDEEDGKCDVNHCSLREAITLANLAKKDSTKEILFEIPKLENPEPGDEEDEPITHITLSSPLPPLTSPNIVLGNEPSPCFTNLTVSGENLEENQSILTIISGKNTVRGLNLVRSPHAGILIIGKSASQNQIYGNIIGLNKNTLPNPDDGNDFGIIIEGGSENIIGGNENPNIISNNKSGGILIFSANTTKNQITKNIIGLSKDAGYKVPNKIGVIIHSSQENDVRLNIISGNGNGILLTGEGVKDNVVKNNFLNYPKAGTREILEALEEDGEIPEDLFSTNENADLYVKDGVNLNDLGGETVFEDSVYDDSNFYVNGKKIKNVINKKVGGKKRLIEMFDTLPRCSNKKKITAEELAFTVPTFDFPIAYSSSKPQYSETVMEDFVEFHDGRNLDEDIKITVKFGPVFNMETGKELKIGKAYVYLAEMKANKKILGDIEVNEGLHEFTFNEDSNMSEPVTIIQKLVSSDKSVDLQFKLGFKILLPAFFKPGYYDYNIDIQAEPL